MTFQQTPNTLVLSGLAIVIVAILISSRIQLRRAPYSMPPGPIANFILGNILQISPKGAWKQLMRYKEQYGDLIYFQGLGNTILVLNTLESINELLEKRGNIYSHRPVFTVVGELMALGQSMPLLPYGKEWREHRKLAHVALGPSTVKKYHVVQEDLAAIMARLFLDDPEHFFSHVRLTAGRIILSVTYGLSVGTVDDQYIIHAEDTMQVIGEATVPGAYLCDLVPIMKYLPSWFSFQREAVIGKAMIERLVTMPFEHVKREMAKGTAAPSLTQDLLSLGETGSDFERRVKWTTGAMYGAGGETTYATVLTFIMAMALHPEKQALVHAEIDSVVGLDRLPTIADLPDLPYFNAVIKETMRWHPVLPLSIARRTSQDDVYRNYFIPKGTIVMPNVWAVAFEPNEKYPAQEFIPERFLDPSQTIPDPAAWAFGFGRRVCPGKTLGENSVFALTATILAAFDIAPPIEGLRPDFEEALVSYPKPFKCQITPRSDAMATLIRRRALQCERS